MLKLPNSNSPVKKTMPAKTGHLFFDARRDDEHVLFDARRDVQTLERHNSFNVAEKNEEKIKSMLNKLAEPRLPLAQAPTQGNGWNTSGSPVEKTAPAKTGHLFFDAIQDDEFLLKQNERHFEKEWDDEDPVIHP